MMFTSLASGNTQGISFMLLHGFAGHPLDWEPTFAASPRPALAAALYGHAGNAVPPPATYWETVDLLARHIASFVAPPQHLCGYSMGARLSLGLLLRYPHMWSAATLVGVHPGLRTQVDRHRRARSDASWQALLRQQDLPSFFAAWEAQPLFATQRQAGRSTQMRRAAQKARRLQHEAHLLARVHASLSLATMPELWSLLPHVHVPVHVITGQQDNKFTQIAHQMQSHLPRGTHTVLAHCGHNPLIDAPEALARAIFS